MEAEFDITKLDLEDLCCLRTLQGKMLDANGQPEDLERLTVEELRRLIDLHYKMKGEANPHKPMPYAPAWCDPDCPRCRDIFSTPDSGVAAAVRQPYPPPEPR